MRHNIHRTGLISVIAALIAGAAFDAMAQAKRSNDPWGWSRHSNENGIRIACQAAKEEYNTIVALHNAAPRHKQKHYKAELNRIRKEINRWCGR